MNLQPGANQALDYSEIKDRIQAIRKEKRYSQRKIAQEMGISYKTYNEFENNLKPSMLKYIDSFARVLDINPVWVINGDAPMDEVDKADELSMKMFVADHDARKMSYDQHMRFIVRILKEDREMRILIYKHLLYFMEAKKIVRDFPTSEKL